MVTVSNASELISSLGSNRRIEVLPGTYNLTTEMNRLRAEDELPYIEDYWTRTDNRSESVTLCSEFDGLELLLENISNLTITAYDKADMPLLVVEPRYAFVMRFRGGRNIRIDGLKMGHTEGGYCEGGVLGFDSADYVAVSGCDLYGCGMEGINAVKVNGLSVDNTTIHDCSYQIMTLQECREVLFYNCRFLRNRQFSTIERLVNAFCSYYPGNVTDKSVYPTKGVKVIMEPKSGYFHSDTDASGNTSDGLEMCYWKMENGYNIVAARVNYTCADRPCVLLMFYRYDPGKDILVPLAMEGPDCWMMEEMFPATLYDGATVELPREGKDIRFRAETGAPLRIARWNNGRFE